MTFFFLVIIIEALSRGRFVRFAGIPIRFRPDIDPSGIDPRHQYLGQSPARSTGPALFAGTEYVGQLWLFWLAPILGAVLAGLITRWLHEAEDAA